MTNVLLLLVEDEAILHAVLQEALTEAGFDVLIRSSGTQAIKELNAGADRFSGILTDIRLGAGPNGWEVGHFARELPRMGVERRTQQRDDRQTLCLRADRYGDFSNP